MQRDALGADAFLGVNAPKQPEVEMNEVASDCWLLVDEIAEYLGIKRDTAYKWIERKKLPAHKSAACGNLGEMKLTSGFAAVPQLIPTNHSSQDNLCFARLDQFGTSNGKA